jgi:hypothetical protein
MRTTGHISGDVIAVPNAMAPVSAVELSLASKIVAEWLTYLPLDCVATMVKQGWDRTDHRACD